MIIDYALRVLWKALDQIKLDCLPVNMHMSFTVHHTNISNFNVQTIKQQYQKPGLRSGAVMTKWAIIEDQTDLQNYSIVFINTSKLKTQNLP